MPVYFDHNASHPLLVSVREKLAEAIFQENPALGNPASIHRKGQRAKKMVAELRAELCKFLGRTDTDEVVFTSGATEALNLAIRGFVQETKKQGMPSALLASTIEHSAVVDTLNDLANTSSVQTSYIGVNTVGDLNFEELKEKVTQLIGQNVNPLLVLQIANNETGSIFDIPALLESLTKEFGAAPTFGNKTKMDAPRRARLYVLIDAVQGLGKMDEAYLRRVLHYADAMVLSAHKMGGPQGIGALWLRSDFPLCAQMTGGTQERRRRAGTFNSLGALGWLYALQDWSLNGQAYRDRMKDLRDYVRLELLKIPGLHIHGNWAASPSQQLCNTLNFHVEGCPEESLLLALDLAGFELSSGSACNSGTLKPSRVLLSMGYPDTVALSSLRLSLGTENTPTQIEAFVETLNEKIQHIRKVRKENRLNLEVLDTELGVF